MFKGNVTLWADSTGGSDAIVQALFFDDAPVAGGITTPPPSPLTNSSTTSITSVSSSQNPAPAGGTVTFTATVSGTGGTPTGTVNFFDGAISLGSGLLDGTGATALSTAGLAADASPHSITAVYSGDGSFLASTSTALSQIITNVAVITITNTPPVTNTAPVAASIDITNALVSRYPLASNGNDTWAGKNLTLVNSPGFISGAVNWNGAEPTLGYSPTHQWPQSGLTVSAWINMGNPTGNYIVATCYENASGSVNQSYFQFFTMNQGLTARIVQNRDVNFIGRTTPAVLTNGWHFVAFTWSGGTASSSIAVYVDGSQVDNADQNGGTFTAPYSGSDVPLTLGAQISPGGGFAGNFYGNQKDVRMYSRALSASEVGVLYTNGANPTVTNAPMLLPPTQFHIDTQ